MKYGNRKTQIDGYVFDSTLEAKRYRQLVLLERAGEIKDLKLQVPYLLQDSFRKKRQNVQKDRIHSGFCLL